MNLQETHLISAVEQRQVLYQTNHPLFRNNGYRKKLWNEISLEIGLSVHECQKNWKRLRQRFRELNRKQESGCPAKTKMYGPLLKLMEFVKPYLEDNRSYIDAVLDDSNSHSSMQPILSETPSTLEEDIKLTSTELSYANIPASSYTLQTERTEENGSRPKQKDGRTGKSTKKAELKKIIKDYTKEHDAISLFCMTLEQDLKNLKPSLQLTARGHISNYMMEMGLLNMRHKVDDAV